MGQARLTTENKILQLPKELQAVLKNNNAQRSVWKPFILEMNTEVSINDFKKFVHDKTINYVIDDYDEQFAELVVSRHPHLYTAPYEVKVASLKDYLKTHYAGRESWQMGSWIYYPWSGHLVHVLERDLFLESRTIRNKNLITPEEQKRFAEFRVACAGMSVGSSAALAIALQGGSNQLKLADNAVISASNLNRILTGVQNVGQVKSVVMAQTIYEMNPYMQINRFDQNIAADSVADFFEQPWKSQAIIDEIDDLKIKILLRVEARKRGIPVLMATDLGDDVMLDVERYDLDAHLPLFHGLAGNIEELLDREVSKREWLKHATSIINTKNVPLRLQQSLLKVGTELVTQPQLGGTAMMAGVVLAYAVRQLAVGESLKSGRTMISLDEYFKIGHGSWKTRQRHRKHTKFVQKSLESL